MCEPSPKKAKTDAPDEKESVTVTYWAGRGLCEPLRIILAAGGEKFENKFLSKPAQLQALRDQNKLSFDQVPLVEVDGLNLVQSVPTALYLGQKYGLYTVDAKKAFFVSHIYTSAMDARLDLVRFPFHGDREQVLKAVNGEKGLFGRYCGKWEAMLQKAGGPFFLGPTPSIADCAVFEIMDFYEEIFGEDPRKKAFEPFPKLTALYSEVLALGRLREWCCEERPSIFLPYSEYKAAVNFTLGR